MAAASRFWEGFARLGVLAAIDVVPTADGGDGTVEAF